MTAGKLNVGPRRATTPEQSQDDVRKNFEEVRKRAQKPAEPETQQIPDKVDLKTAAASTDYSDIPIIEVNQIPSRGLSYPPNFKISYRPYVHGEIKRESGSKTTVGEEYRGILEGIYTSFPKEDLNYYDFLYISLLRKISTLGENTIIASHTCPNPKCGSFNSYDINVGPDKCEIIYWDAEYPELPIVADLEICGTMYSCEFMPITIGQYLKLEEMKLHRDDIALEAIQCVNMDFDVAMGLFDKATKTDRIVLQYIDELLYTGVKSIPVKCPKCEQSNNLKLDGGGIVIRPFRSTAEIAADRVHFGTKTGNKSDSSQ